MTTIAPTRRSLLAAAIVSLTAFGAAATTEAATITWGAATNIAGASDVSTAGIFVGAVNTALSGVGSTSTVNGTTFTAWDPNIDLSSGIFSVNTPTGGLAIPLISGTLATLSPAYADLLRDAAFLRGPLSIASGDGTFTALQVRNITAVAAVPEPGSALVGMLALGLCGAGSARRRRAHPTPASS